ncbi:MAG: UDP-4-amino-4,6-dideoxy-N-acetyl-beta-L-altrosamine transaminase [Actinomycetota bacterium]|nr:UDP-4-amino-4,6-dideoxy-N-acetyl-beta-L-altrosamine transaminase [Actinomycetota bacterium]
MSERRLPYGRQEVSDADVDAVVAALRSELITQGPTVERFEHAFAEYVGAAHAVAFSSGTAALHGAAFAAGVEEGDEVITTPITFAASANCALYQGARPRFVDIDPATWNLDVEAAASAVGERTRAVVAVSYGGLPVELGPLQGDFALIEDGCHALGGHRDGRKVGGPGGADMTCFSFHPVKAMTTGEGGMVTTEDPDLAHRLRTFRTHGITREGMSPGPDDGGWYYEMQTLGFNYRITDLQCALGISQLSRLDRWVARRNELAAAYRELLASEERIGLPPPAAAGSLHGYHLFPVRVRAGAGARHRAFEALRAAGVGVQVHYIPIYRLPYYRDELGYPQDACPQAEALYSGLISLPMFPAMSDSDVEWVVAELSSALGQAEARSNTQ